MKTSENQTASKAQKLGAGYPFRATFIALICFFFWLIWIIFMPSITPMVSTLESLHAYKQIPYAGKLFSWISPSREESVLFFSIWATLLTVRVISISPLFRVRIKNIWLRTRNLFKCFMTSYVAIWLACCAAKMKRYKTSLANSSKANWLFPLAKCLHVALLLFVLAPLSYFTIFFILKFCSVLLLPIVETLALLWGRPWDEISLVGSETSALWSLFWFFAKFWFISTLILSGSFRFFKWMHGLGESHILRRIFVIGRGASSRWAGPAVYRIMPTSSGGSRIFLGTTDFFDVGPEYGEAIYLEGSEHVLTLACPGAGKSVTSIWPTLALYEGSSIIADFKGEHARETFWHRNSPEFRRQSKKLRKEQRKENVRNKKVEQATNYSTAEIGDIRTKNTLFKWNDKNLKSVCFKLDPFNQQPFIPNSYYNFLDEIDVEDDKVRELLSAISDGCVLSEGSKNKFFTDNAKIVIEGLIVFILSCYDKKYHSLCFLADLLMEFDPEGGGLADPQRLDDVMYDMRKCTAAGGICAQAANVLGDREGELYHSIMGTIRRSIKWMGDPAMRKQLSNGADFSFKDFRQETPHTLYIVAPIGEALKEQVRWLRVLTNFGITLMKREDPKGGETLVVLDEFARMGGALSAITEGLTTLRSSEIKLFCALQNMNQLKQDYGEQFNDFIESSTVQVFGTEGAGGTTAQWVSKSLGYYYNKQDSENKDARTLLTPQEVSEFLGKGKDNQIIFHQGIPFPMRLKRRAHVRIKNRDGGFKRHPQMYGCFERQKNK